MKRSLLLTAFIIPVGVYAQINPGPRSTALGSTGVVLQDVWSLQSNQAGLAALKRPAASAAIENLFVTSEVSTKSAVAAVPFKQDVFGLSFQSYGFSAYTEQRAGFTYARTFNDVIFTALNINYHQLVIPKYGSTRTFSVEGGLQYKASEKLLIGAHVANPSQSSYEEQTASTIPVKMEFGIAYRFTDKVLFNSAFSKKLNSDADAGFGLEYTIAEWLALRGGLTANPLRQQAGFGLVYQNIRIDAAASSHPVLGYSPQIALSYEF